MKEAELNRILLATQVELAREGKLARGHGDKRAHARGPEAQRLGGPEMQLG